MIVPSALIESMGSAASKIHIPLSDKSLPFFELIEILHLIKTPRSWHSTALN